MRSRLRTFLLVQRISESLPPSRALGSAIVPLMSNGFQALLTLKTFFGDTLYCSLFCEDAAKYPPDVGKSPPSDCLHAPTP